MKNRCRGSRRLSGSRFLRALECLSVDMVATKAALPRRVNKNTPQREGKACAKPVNSCSRDGLLPVTKGREQETEHPQAFIHIAMTNLMSRKLARHECRIFRHFLECVDGRQDN